MKRCHLFELEDQPWFPAVVRDLATDYLHFIQHALKLEGALLPLIRKALVDGRTTKIVDLCSGGSGPVPALVERLNAEGTRVTATLTDLFPNVAAFEAVATQSHGAITFEPEPVDARAVPPSLAGLRTIFNGFHHLKPADARAVLHAAAAARQPIAIFEVSERSLRTMPVVLTPLVVWLGTPFMRPFRWRRLLFTYPIPLVPLTCLWDGIVSQLRAYTVDELRQLAQGSAPMTWEAGQVPIAKGRGRLTFLIGVPPAEVC
jgi:hypothetical protein